MNTIKWVTLILIFSKLMGCIDSNAIRIDKDILNGWDIENSIKFEINDTIDFSSNIFFHVRNNDEYPFSNIFLISSLKSKQKIYETDTLEYVMADSKGEWLGEGFSRVKESKLLWKRNWKPNFLPPYIFEIKQANRKIKQLKQTKSYMGFYPLAYQLRRYQND